MEQQSRQKTGRFRIKDTFYALYIVFYIRLPTHQVMFDRRHLSADFPSQRFIGCYYVQFILHTWFALLVFSFLISFPRFGLEEYTTTTHITTQETTTLFTLYGIRPRFALAFEKILIVFIVLSGIDLEIYFWMKWCLVKVFKTTNDVWKREVNWYYGK